MIWMLLPCCALAPYQGLVNVWALSNYSFDLVEKYQSVWEVFHQAIAKSRPVWVFPVSSAWL